MYIITSNLIWICPIISLACLIVLTTINAYKLIRRNFPIKVNCWFCNQWTKVSYNNRNSFECPSCLQYNGFNLDGGYNRVLPAQYDEHLNKSVEASQRQDKVSVSNGLCRICNNNQQLRVFQLANFIPLNEENFDVEIEHFEKQLDKAYKLCRKCENTVKKTIQKQHSRLGIKLTKLGRKGISLIDLTASSNGISSKTKRSIFKNVLFYTIIFFACLNITHLLTQTEFFDERILPKKVLAYGASLQNVYVAFKTSSSNVWNRFLNNSGVNSAEQVIQAYVSTFFNYDFVKELIVVMEIIWTEMTDTLSSILLLKIGTDNSILFYFVGTLLQFIWLFINGAGHKKNIILLLVWTELLCLESGMFEFSKGYSSMLQIASAAIIIFLMFLKNRSKTIRMKKKTIRTYNNEPREALGNLSDDEVVDRTKIKPVFNFNTQSKAHEPFCDNGIATDQVFSVGSKTNSTDLDISLDKLHIGSRNSHAAKKSVLKSPYVNQNSERPKPLLSPPKLQNVSPTSRVNNINNLSNCNQCFGYESNRFNLNPSPNPCCDSIGYQPLFPDPMFNVSATRMLGKHITICYPRFPYANNCNASFQPMLNNEQLVYLSPNYVQSNNMYEMFPGQNLSTNSFDSFNDKVMDHSGSSFRNFHKLESEWIKKK